MLGLVDVTTSAVSGEPPRELHLRAVHRTFRARQALGKTYVGVDEIEVLIQVELGSDGTEVGHRGEPLRFIEHLEFAALRDGEATGEGAHLRPPVSRRDDE